MRRAHWRSALALGLGLSLAGCNIAAPSFPGLSGGTPVQRLAILGGDLTAVGPRGYCVDAGASRPGDGLALIAACSTLAGEGALPWRNAVIVVQAGPEGSATVTGSETDLRALVATEAGRALLSGTGQAGAITIRRADSAAGLVTVIYTDTGPGPVPGTQSTEWRAFIDLRGRLVTISLRGLAATPLDDNAGLSLLRDAVSALQSANPGDGG